MSQKEVPQALAEQAWQIAGSVEWDAMDWMLFHQALTQVFMRIAAKHAAEKIRAAEAAGGG